MPRKLTEAQIREMTARYWSGCFASELAAEYGVHESTVRGWARWLRGNPRGPLPCWGGARRHYHGMPEKERRRMHDLLRAGWSIQKVAQFLGRHPSTIYNHIGKEGK